MANAEKTSQVTAVVGGQWGDEGKGKIIDLIAPNAEAVIRAQGGDNAGHTVVNPRGKFALHLVPSGICNEGVKNVIATGVMVNPDTVLREMAELRAQGLPVDATNLAISQRAHIVFDHHLYTDGGQEDGRGEMKIGTTRRGIGPATQDKMGRSNLRIGDLKRPEEFMKKLDANLEQKREALRLQGIEIPDVLQTDFYAGKVTIWREQLCDMITDTEALTHAMLYAGQNIIVESAQGALLDINRGTYPNVTSSGTNLAGVLDGAGIPPQALTESIMVIKAYITRVGAGGMPTEVHGKIEDFLRTRGQEYGATTGRPRRVGWFDGTAARFVQMNNGFDKYFVTKLDILTGVADLKVGTGYIHNRELISTLPENDAELQKCNALLRSVPTIPDFDTTIQSLEELPEEARRYLAIMDQLINDSVFKKAKLMGVGTGPGREQVILV